MGYVYAAIALAFASLAAYAFYERGQAIAAVSEAVTLRANNATLERANADKDAAIVRQEARYMRLDKLLSDVRAEVAELNVGYAANTKALDDLGNTDETVKLFLDTPYPDNLKRLLNN